MKYGWLNNYIGLPYLSGGRDMDGADCYGLIKLVTEEHFGWVLPDWEIDTLDLGARNEAIEDVVTSGDFLRKDFPADGDIAVCYRGRIAVHVGICFRDGVLHTAQDGQRGAVFEPLPKFVQHYGSVIFGQWTP